MYLCKNNLHVYYFKEITVNFKTLVRYAPFCCFCIERIQNSILRVLPTKSWPGAPKTAEIKLASVLQVNDLLKINKHPLQQRNNASSSPLSRLNQQNSLIPN